MDRVSIFGDASKRAAAARRDPVDALTNGLIEFVTTTTNGGGIGGGPETEIVESRAFIQWRGGECPVDPETNVLYHTRSGDYGNARADCLRWSAIGCGGDIVRYWPGEVAATKIDQRRHRIRWHGGECPVDPETYVGVLTRGGRVSGSKAGHLSWKALGRDNDIVSYWVDSPIQARRPSGVDLASKPDQTAVVSFQNSAVASLFDPPFISNAAWQCMLYNKWFVDGDRLAVERRYAKIGCRVVTDKEAAEAQVPASQLKNAVDDFNDVWRRWQKDVQALESEVDRLRRLVHRLEYGPPPFPGPKKRWRSGMLP